MADRQVKVTLVAQATNYIAGMERAAVATASVGKAGEKLAAQKVAFESVGRAALVFGAVAAAGVALAIVKFAEFDAAMANVNAVTQETAGNMALLRDAAIDAGGKTQYTASEAANAIEELGKAGLTTADILGGALSGALALAASDNLAVARAAEITATTLKQFNLAGTEAGRVADVLAAGAGKALGGVEDLAQGLKFVGPIAGAMGISLEDVTATLALFADQGIIGEQAGSALRGMLSSLQSPTAAAQAKLDDLGISLYDVNGSFVGLGPVVQQLNTALGDADDQTRDTALGLIFTNAQLTTAQVLVGEAGAKWGEYRDGVEDAGYATQIAADRMNNLNGDLEKLGGAFDSALIKTGSAANDVLRTLVQSATEAVDYFGNLPTPVLAAELAFGALTAAVALGGGAFFTAVPKVAAYREVLATMGPVAQRTGRALEAVGKAGGAIVAVGLALEALSLLAHSMETASASAEQLQNALLVNTDATKIFTTALKGLDDQDFGAIDRASQDWGKFIKQISSAPDTRWLPGFTHDLFALDKQSDKARDQIAALGTEIAGLDPASAAATFQLLVEEMGGGAENARLLLDLLPDYKTALTTQATAAGLAADDQTLLNIAMAEVSPVAQTAAGSYLEAADAAGGLTDEVLELISAINEANGVGQDAVTSNIDYQNALAGVDDYIRQAREGVEGYALTLDQSTQVGRDNMEMLVGLAGDYQIAAEKQFALDGNTENYIANLQAGRDAVLQRAEDLGANADQVQFLTDNIVAMPSNKEVRIIADTGEALRRIQEVRDSLAAFQNANVTLSAYTRNEVGGFYSGGVREFANGGFPSGIYKGGQNIHKFAETGLPWETYISPKPGHERENIGYALESLSRLGVNLSQLAGGVGSGDNGSTQTILDAISKMTGPRSNPPVVIATESTEAIGRSVARNSRPYDRQGGVTNG